MDLAVLTQAIDQLVESDPSAYGDEQSLTVLYRELARLDAYVTRSTAAFDAAKGFGADGARSAASWLAKRCRVPRGYARKLVRRGRELRDLPVAAQAWLAGEITGSHIDVIATCRREGTAEAIERDEELLVDHARTLGFDSFARAVAYWGQLADPDGAEAAEAKRRDRRSVFLSESFQGMWFGRITMDPISGEIVGGELARLERELFDKDWAEARLGLGRDPLPGELERSGAQRRADALVEMATRSRGLGAGSTRPAPLFSVYVGYETLHGRICELASGTAVAPGSLLAWLDQAYVERAVFSLPNRVEVSESARFFSGATRRAIELRDRRCCHPYCDEPAETCQGDHIQPFSQGGKTTQDNGRLLCAFHNRARNQRPPPGPP